MENFHTTADVFIVILLAYLVITLGLGAKQLYFGKFVEKEEKGTQANTGANNQSKS